MSADSFGSRDTLEVGGTSLTIYRLDALEKARVGHLQKLPFSMRVLLENLLRNEDGRSVTRDDIEAVANWDPKAEPSHEIAFRPSRVLLQDFTGVPAVVDLAAMRDAVVELGGEANQINPLQPADLVIDHSVQVDRFGSKAAFMYNAHMENERNKERYAFLRWGQTAFDNFSVVPPDTGIVHQVNLEYLAKVLFTKTTDGETVAYPDSLVGTDSHSTMINGLGVVGWGVGGIEAEAAMLGQPIAMLVPQVVGFKLTGELAEGVTATDLVLTVVQMLRAHGVVGKFVEFYGSGVSKLTLADRATLSNMGPEYGATIGFFPVDDETLRYLRFTGRSEELVQQVEAYYKAQGMFRTDDAPEPEFSSTLELDMSTVQTSIAGPKRPQDRIALRGSKPAWRKILTNLLGSELGDAKDSLAGWVEGGEMPDTEAVAPMKRSVEVTHAGQNFDLDHGKVVIAAITSCTNTSNPSVMLAAGLVAKNAVERGLAIKPWVKSSLAPGSKVVTEYLEKAGLMPYLEGLRFHLVGYGCTTCIGNSGPLPGPISEGINEADLVACSVLSGNRNFEGRIGPDIRANFLASPPLVVAYALAGTLDIDLYNEPLGYGPNGEEVFLKDIWPTTADVAEVVASALKPEQFKEQYSNVYEGDEVWRNLEIPEGERFAWDESSTYVRQPPFFVGMTKEPPALSDIKGARLLALLGDSITTDHISPAGGIAPDSPAAKYLTEHGVKRKYFNSYGSRRGNHEVMMRGTFANVRLRNQLAPGTEGGWTTKLPEGEVQTIYDAAMAYREEGTPIVVIGGKEYGSGSSRDWAAKGPALLGVKAVIAESYERIHRSNCIGMGILPLQFKPGESAKTHGITGTEVLDFTGIAEGLEPGATITVTATAEDGSVKTFETLCRIDTPVEVDYYRNGGILQYVLRNMVGTA